MAVLGIALTKTGMKLFLFLHSQGDEDAYRERSKHNRQPRFHKKHKAQIEKHIAKILRVSNKAIWALPDDDGSLHIGSAFSRLAPLGQKNERWNEEKRAEEKEGLADHSKKYDGAPISH